jgi:hypothetical protein
MRVETGEGSDEAQTQAESGGPRRSRRAQFRADDASTGRAEADAGVDAEPAKAES